MASSETTTTQDDPERWRIALECANLGVWDADLVAGRCYYSPSWKAMLGYGQDEIGDDPDLWLNLIHPDDRERAIAAGDRHIAGECDFIETEFRLKHREGRWIWVLDRGRVVARDAQGRATRMIGVQTDISRQKAAEIELLTANDRMQLALDAGSVGLWQFDSATGSVTWDARMREIYGIPQGKDPLPASTWHDRLHPDDAEAAEAAIMETLETGAPMRMTYRIVTPQGQTRHLHALARRVALTNAPLMLVGSIWDITEQSEREQRLQSAEAEYRNLFDNAVIGIYRSTPAGRMVRANAALVQLNGYTCEADLIAAVHDISAEWYVDEGRRDEFKRVMNEHGIVTDFVSEVYRHGTRERIWISENAWAVRDADGAIVAYEGSVVEATARKRMEVEHERLARRDALTGLANRLQLDETLDKALSTAAPQVAVVCLDLDRFKAVNDAFGHPVGDTLLVEAARRLQACAKPGDTIVRVGGDEFTIVRPRYETHGEVERLAQSLTTAFRKPFLLAGQMMLVHTSVGVAMALQDGSSRRELIEKADAALYRAKAEGRNRHAFASPLPDVQSTHAAGKSATGRT